MDEDYDIDQEEQMLLDWQRFEEEKLNKSEVKIIPFSTTYNNEIITNNIKPNHD